MGTSSFIEGSFNKICLKFDNIVRHIVRFKCIEGEERVSGVIEGGGGQSNACVAGLHEK